MVEMAIILSIFFVLTLGLIDVGRAFYQYNAISTAARYAARWGSVVGGTCATTQEALASGSNDWCYQLGSQLTTPFWQQPGNMPLQPGGTPCPSSYGDPSFPSADYYTVSDYDTPSSTTIIGSVAQRFDTNSTSSNVLAGAATPGFDLTQLKACIQLPWDSVRSAYATAPGNRVEVYLYYKFAPITTLLAHANINLTASSTYGIE